MTKTLIPGVYTSYELSGVRYTGKNTGTAGIVWKGSVSEREISAFTGYSQAAAALGTDSEAAKLCRLLFENGASKVKTVQTDGDYTSAFALLMKESDVKVMLCDTTDSTVHGEMLRAIERGNEESKYRIGIVGGTGDVNALSVQAKALNSERMVLTPDTVTAAALAGIVLGTEDPSIPFNGAVLSGADGDFTYTEDELKTLIASGVTPFVTIGGVCETVRAVTTKTVTEGTDDITWRDLNTVLIADYAISGIRNVLKAMFTRAKNTERTRGAVRTQVVIELEKMLDAGIIDSYGNVSAKKSAEDPSVCSVEFEFAVSGGMHSIVIAAGIIV